LIAEVLHWPVEWSRLFGIAEITTPALKISTRTDWTPTKQSFSRAGQYRAPKKTWWTLNGFSSADGMRDSHRDMVDALVTQLPPKARVLDLGCGNGMLLRRLTIHRPDIRIAGVDNNAEAIREAQETIDLRSTFWHGAIQDVMWVDWKPTVVLFNPARLREMTPADASRASAWIREIPWQFPYMYDDWQKKASLTTLCEEYQLTAPQPFIKTHRVEMGMVAPFT
jgi:SAM-dependent methyltransferase